LELARHGKHLHELQLRHPERIHGPEAGEGVVHDPELERRVGRELGLRYSRPRCARHRPRSLGARARMRDVTIEVAEDEILGAQRARRRG
jgi:hypothetical protein